MQFSEGILGETLIINYWFSGDRNHCAVYLGSIISLIKIVGSREFLTIALNSKCCAFYLRKRATCIYPKQDKWLGLSLLYIFFCVKLKLDVLDYPTNIWSKSIYYVKNEFNIQKTIHYPWKSRHRHSKPAYLNLNFC